MDAILGRESKVKCYMFTNYAKLGKESDLELKQAELDDVNHCEPPHAGNSHPNSLLLYM